MATVDRQPADMQTVGVPMAALAKQVFGDLGRLAVRMARLDTEDKQKQAMDAYEKATGRVEARVRDAELEGSDLDADWRAVNAVFDEMQTLYDKLSKLGYGAPFLPPTLLAEVQTAATASGARETRGRRALREMLSRLPSLMEAHWGDVHAARLKAQAKLRHQLEFAAAMGAEGSSIKRPRTEWQRPPALPRTQGAGGPAVVYEGRTVLICSKWLADPRHSVPCARASCRFAPCGGHNVTGPAALTAAALEAVKAEALRQQRG
jgi:hypothetical protein